MTIHIGAPEEKAAVLAQYPYTKQVIGADGATVIAAEDQKVIGVLWGFVRESPAPVAAKELFINVTEVFDQQACCKGIGSGIVQKCI